MLCRADLKKSFEEIDTDKSGSIEMSELKNLCTKIGLPDVDDAKVTELFTEIDTNHDGKVSFDEFTAWYRLGRNSKLRDVLKFQLSSMSKFDAHFTKKYSKLSNFKEEGRSTFVDVDIRDGEPSESKGDCYFQVTSNASAEDIAIVREACPKMQLTFGADSGYPEGTNAFTCKTVNDSF